MFVLNPRVLRIPAGLEWRAGAFGHQGLAVDAFLNAEGRGVLAIATGGGKTRTALIAACHLQDQHNGPMLVVILAPSRPLTRQWADEVREFGVVPLSPSLFESPKRKAFLEEVKAALALGEKRTEVIIATNALFTQDDALGRLLADLDSSVLALVIGDEMHNLGVPSFLSNPPERFDKRLGLSATPVRQYDPDGTDQLFHYFGPQVFEFSLGDAIRAGCLTTYSYYLHEVALTSVEMDKYVELTEQLRSAGFHTDDDGRTVIPNAKVERLLRERRAVLEQAEAKLGKLRELLLRVGPENVRRSLIYASAKPSILERDRQIEQVNGLLAGLGIVSHQFTSAETARADADEMLAKFARGDYQVLTAMRVLDEGVDIPQTDTAYILASSTVRREWVQRRGRVLRRAPGKERATLHDFLVIPPEPASAEGRAVLRGELKRTEEFASLAENEWANDGPRSIIDRFESFVWGGTGSV